MSRLYVLLIAVIAITAKKFTQKGERIHSERVNHGYIDQIEKPIMIRRDVVFPRIRNVVPFVDSSSIFCLKLNKYKPQYQQLDRIYPTTTTAAPVTTACICVPFYLCNSNQTIITDGAGVIDPRVGGRICPGILEVCCYPPNITVTPTRPTMTFPTRPTMTIPTAIPTIPTMTFPTRPTIPPMTFPTAIPTLPTMTFPTRPTIPPMTFPTAIPTLPTMTFPTVPPTTATPTTNSTVSFPTSVSTNAPTTRLPNCICVTISQCDPNGIVTVSGEGVINPRYGLCPGTLICCRILVNTTSSPTTMTTVPPTVTTAPPTQTLCFVCGNVTLCFTCTIIITPGGGTMIDPRFSQVLSQGNICTAWNIPSCQNTSSDAQITDLGPPKNPGTSQECYCVKTWLCSAGNTVSPDGLGIIDERFTLCSLADQVCCRLAGIDQSFRSADTPVFSFKDLEIANEPFDLSATGTACGIQNNNYAPPQPFPAGSEKTYFAEFPWMVALLKSATNGSYIFQCGASLVSNWVVLTAAHCVVNQKAENLIARFGQWNIENNIQPLPTQEAKILAITVHPSYYSGGLFHDVAVLILSKPVSYRANIRPICLPEQGTVFVAGTRCLGTGWGSDSFGPEGQYQAELRKVNLPIVSREDCQTRLRSTKLGQYFQLHGSFICAGGEANRDTCRGDGGGPLVCQSSTGRFVQAGIVSWGIGCGVSNVPAVYASVSQHRQWIDQQFATFGV